jgi:DNA polymerase I-like protein with 3'-5' exonuclease and polymerase domains
MPLERPKHPKKRTVCIINDYPVKAEVSSGDRFSAPSNMNMLTSFRTGKVNVNSISAGEEFKGIISTDIFCTYLDYDCFADGNFDFCKDFRKRKDLIAADIGYFLDKETETNIFYKLEHQKDLYISDRLWKCLQSLIVEINQVEPKLIIVTGKWTLFLLTACTTFGSTMGNAKDRKPFGGLTKFRSSILKPHECWNLRYIEGQSPIVIPIYHPVNSISMPDKARTMELDIQKICWMYHKVKEHGIQYYTKPDKNFVLGTDYSLVIEYLDGLLSRLDLAPTLVSVDIETMFHSVIDCIGITDSINSGICVPFASVEVPNFWSIEDEIDIILKIKEVLLHPNCMIVGQNFLYDSQYLYKYWNINVYAKYDSMIMHHVLFNNLPKSLDFLASLYCEFYTYWKDEVEATKESPETRWTYNVKDICYTLEVAVVLLELLAQEKPALQEFYRFQQEEVVPAIVDIMNIGVKVDLQKKQQLHDELQRLSIYVEQKINSLIGEEINLKSPIQIKKLFMDLLGVKPVADRKRKTESFGSAAMLVYLEEYPEYAPLITMILEYRSINIFVRTFLSAKVDDDNRMRTSYNVAGTKSYRLASRKNAFGAGMNLQNVPSKGKIDLKYALMDYSDSEDIELEDEAEVAEAGYGVTELPNCKELFICEDDEMFFDIDLAAADARIIAWVSGCKFLTDLFEDPKADIYAILASEYTGRKIVKKDPERQQFKAICHGTNYLGKPKTLAAKEGMLVHQVEKVQRFYFDICPEIQELHKEVEKQVRSLGYLENCWGARGWFLDKNDPMLMNKAMAWVGSSPVSILINKGLVRLKAKEKDIKVLLQVHDSLAGVFKKTDLTAPERIIQHVSIPLPFDRPRIIPVNIKTSPLSYGNCG